MLGIRRNERRLKIRLRRRVLPIAKRAIGIDIRHRQVQLLQLAPNLTDLPLVQRLNDVMGLEVGDGTPEIMKGVIAREAMGREYTSYR
jgi:hypothetical protein